MKNIKNTRKVLSVGAKPADVYDINTWSKDQIRLAGAWSKHECDSYYDKHTAPYDWVPDWTGNLNPFEVNEMVHSYYMRG